MNFFVKNMYLTYHNKKKIIKFTRISRTVWTFAKKNGISQNTENFHQCMYKSSINILSLICFAQLDVSFYLTSQAFYVKLLLEIHSHNNSLLYIYSQTCLKGRLYITNHCLWREGISIKQITVYEGHLYITNHCL